MGFTIPKISVLVPVYNTITFIDKCLFSLTAQTLKEIEIIVVDDGSTDGSGEKCDEWALRDSRISVIHQKNRGSAVARQVAMDRATGEYVIVCDSDDWVEVDAYRKVYAVAKCEDADMVFFGYWAEYENGTRKEWVRTYADLSDIDLVRAEIMKTSAYTSWNKLIRRSLFVENGISYEPGINMGEDKLIIQKLLTIRPLKLAIVPEALYHYRQREGGYTHAMKTDSVMQLIHCHQWDMANLDREKFGHLIIHGAAGLAFDALRCDKFPTNVYRCIIQDIPVKFLYKSPRSPQKLLVLLSKILGPALSHGIYMKTKKKFFS